MKNIILRTCCTFTLVTLLFAIFSDVGLTPESTNTVIYQILIMTLSISVAMDIGERIEERLDITSSLVDILIRIIICYVFVFLEGVAFHMFPLKLSSLLLISPVLLPTFIATYTLFWFMSKQMVKEINESIKRNDNSNR